MRKDTRHRFYSEDEQAQLARQSAGHAVPPAEVRYLRARPPACGSGRFGTVRDGVGRLRDSSGRFETGRDGYGRLGTVPERRRRFGKGGGGSGKVGVVRDGPGGPGLRQGVQESCRGDAVLVVCENGGGGKGCQVWGHA